jgi:2-methylisocitrate lyase-like PEP mutase family enzyme
MSSTPRRTVSGQTLRDTLAGGNTVLMPGVWDPLSARLARAAGFSTAFLSGYCVSGTQLGVPDIGLLTQTEMAEVARRVCRSVPDLMVVVDADTGYGNPLNVVRTVDLWEEAGATGLFLEDQQWPKRCGHMAGKVVIERDDWLAKLRAALRRRQHLFVTARTDARAPLGLDEAIERARMAADLGADAVFVEAPESLAELERIAAALPDVARVANMVETGATPLLTPDELHALGFDLIVSPLSGLFSLVRSLRRAFDLLHEKGTLRDDLDQLVSFDEFTAAVDLAGWVELDQSAALAPRDDAGN